MACDLKEIKDSTFNSVKDIIEGNSTTIRMAKDGKITFDHTKSQSYTTKEAAFGVAKGRASKVSQWAKETFGESFGKDWINIHQEGDSVYAQYSFPANLEKAYNQKLAWDQEAEMQKKELSEAKKDVIQSQINDLINGNEQQQSIIKDLYGNEYTSIDELVNGLMSEVEFDNAIDNVQKLINPNYSAYQQSKEKTLDRVNKTIDRLYTEKRIDNTKNISKRINKLTSIKEEIEKDLDNYSKSQDKLTLVKSFFTKDMALIKDLLNNPTLENLFLAQDIFRFIQLSADTNNLKNFMFNPGQVNNKSGENSKYANDVQELIDTLNLAVNDIQKDLNIALDKEFGKLLENYGEKLTSLYPGKDMDQIKDELLKNLQDIHYLESKFFTVDQNLASESDVIGQLLRLEYERTNEKEKAKSQKIIQAIDGLLPSVHKELSKLGWMFSTKLGNIHNYNWLYQTDSKGHTQPELIGKFSKDWNSFVYRLNKVYNQKVFEARQSKNWSELETTLTNKYNDLNDKVDFVDFGLLHEVFSDPAYTEFQKGTASEAAAYKQQLIAKIGEEEFEDLIERQRNYLDSFIEERSALTTLRLSQEGVPDVSQLTEQVRNNLDITLARLNPALFMDSHNSDNKGMIAYQVGTQMNEKPSYIKYNTYIPKAQSNTGMATGFYDEGFKRIEANPTLYNFYKVMRDATKTINENLIDSSLGLNKNSILLFNKTFRETLVDKNYLQVVKAGLGSFNGIKQFLKNQFSAKDIDRTQDEEIQLPAGIVSFRQAVDHHFSLVKTEIANIIGKQVTNGTILEWNALSTANRQAILELLGEDNLYDFFKNVEEDKGKIKMGNLRVYSQQKIFEQQTLNLPSMIKAQLELSAEHKSRSVAKNKLDVLLQKSRQVLSRKSRKSNITENQENGLWSKDRGNANTRNDFFFKQVVLNDKKDPTWGNISNELKKLAKVQDGKVLGSFFYKNYTPEEKKVYYSAIKRLDKIDEQLAKTTNQKEIASLTSEQAVLNKRILMLGKDYLASAIFHAAFNKMGILVNMGFSLPVAINNYFNGHMMLFNRDGEYWTKGNINLAWHYVTQNKLRFVNPKYKESWNMMGAFIKQLNIIQDGTNELQRAEENTSFLHKGLLHPMYGTELVEWYNQVPGILSMAMDIEVAPGVPLFDGKTFPAHKLVNGVFTLKDEYRTPENIKDFEEISSDKMLDWKLGVNDMIRSLNGDYSKTGVTRIKGGVVGKQVMQFKTWLPRYISSRLAYKQKDLISGEEKTGYLLSSLINPKTALASGLLTISTLAIGALSGPSVVWMLPLLAPIIGLTIATKLIAGKSIQMDLSEVLNIRQQLAYVAKSLTIGTIETPVNLIGGLAGKRTLIDLESGFKGKLSDQETKDLRLLAKHMQFSLGILLLRLIIQGMIGDNEEKELKGKRNSRQRAIWEAQQIEKDANKQTYNLLENFLTSRFQELNLANDPTSLWSTMGSKNGLENNAGKLTKAFANTASAFFFPEDDIITSGDKAGQSKAGNTWRKLLLPSPIRGAGQDTWQYGFESWTQKEWQNNDFTDKVFDSDYKVDKKKIEHERKATLQELKAEYELEHDVKLDDLEPSDKDKIERKLKKKALKEDPNPKRKQYDENQNAIEEE